MSTTHEKLLQHASDLKKTPLSELLSNSSHCEANYLTLAPHIDFDFSRHHFTKETLDLLLEAANEAKLDDKIKAMANGSKINSTEGRAVLHMALRANPQDDVKIDRLSYQIDETRLKVVHPGEFQFDSVPTNTVVQPVLDKIEQFTADIENERHIGTSGKKLTNFLVVGIGGSYLGTQFIYDSMKMDQLGGGYETRFGKNLRFIANVDPVDFAKAVEGLDAKSTLVIIISKTFTTAETMKNATLVKNWLLSQYAIDTTFPSDQIIAKHFVACSTAVEKAVAFGIDQNNIFPFWDWVGGRYSVSSCVGVLPLSLYFSYAKMKEFLAGCHDMDRHFLTAPLSQNLPVILGLLGLWNSQYLNYESRCIVPYCEMLASFVSHIQQVDMESNGKRVDINGNVVQHTTGEIDFGTPGTNSQHSYFQLFHQGRTVPVDFIGFVKSQFIEQSSESGDSVSHCSSSSSPTQISSHDELMCNFFAQPDALAFGTVNATPLVENPHKHMPGNRPSSILLLSSLSFYTVGLLLSLYEHRTAVQGFMWNLNSFDQFGVELGKVLAGNVRNFFQQQESGNVFKGNTNKLLHKYVAERK